MNAHQGDTNSEENSLIRGELTFMLLQHISNLLPQFLLKIGMSGQMIGQELHCNRRCFVTSDKEEESLPLDLSQCQPSSVGISFVFFCLCKI